MSGWWAKMLISISDTDTDLTGVIWNDFIYPKIKYKYNQVS